MKCGCVEKCGPPSPTGYFLSMVKLKLATALELLTILSPDYFLAMGSAANSIKV